MVQCLGIENHVFVFIHHEWTGITTTHYGVFLNFIFSSVWEHADIFDDKGMQSENHHQDLEELSCHNISALAARCSD